MKKKKIEEEVAAEDEDMCYCNFCFCFFDLMQFVFTIYLLSKCGVCFGADPASLCSSLFFIYLFIFVGTCLLLLLWFFFFFLTNPFVQDLKLSDLLPIFVLLRVLSFLLDLIITSYRCISQNSPEKLKQKKLFEPQKPVTVLRTVRSDHGSHGSLLFPH